MYNNTLNKLIIITIIQFFIISLFLVINTHVYATHECNIETITLENNNTKSIKINEISSSRNISFNTIDSYTDLSVMNDITTDELNTIIEYWNSIYSGDSPFLGQGQLFIDAALETGLDPVYILAHAAVESAWGTSYYAINYHNYFGIGAFDDNPDNAINYNNRNLREGIINGSKWIKENYYNNGQTNLFSMRYNNGYNEYCTSTSWIYSISDIIRTSYSLIHQ